MGDEYTTSLLMRGELLDPEELLLAGGVDPMAFSDEMELGPEPSPPKYEQPSTYTTPLSFSDRMAMGMSSMPDFQPIPYESGWTSALRGLGTGFAKGFSSARLGKLDREDKLNAAKTAAAKTAADRNFLLSQYTYREKLSGWLKRKADAKDLITVSRKMAQRMGRPEFMGRRMNWKTVSDLVHTNEREHMTDTQRRLEFEATEKHRRNMEGRETVDKGKEKAADYDREVKRGITDRLRMAKTMDEAIALLRWAKQKYPQAMAAPSMRLIVEETEERLRDDGQAD